MRFDGWSWGWTRRVAAAMALAALAVAAAPAWAKEAEKAPAPGAGKPAAKDAEQPPERPPMDTWYAQALAHAPIGINVTHFWSKKNKMRAETVIAGRRIVTIVDERNYIAYDLLVRTGIVIQRSELARKQDAERQRPFGNEYFSLKRQGAEYVDSETLGGRGVDLYQVTDKLGKRQVWVTQDEERLPVRIHVFLRGNGQEFTTDYLNWQRGLPILDEFFLPEPGIKLLAYSYDEFVKKQADHVPIGPVPVLYTDLLHGY